MFFLHGKNENCASLPMLDRSRYNRDNHEKRGADMADLLSLAKGARQAALTLAATDENARNTALTAMADALERHADALQAANAKDLAEAAGLDAPLVKRLKFDAAKLRDVCDGLRALVRLPDPIGETQRATELAEGLALYRVSCPIGVVGVVFEARPDALVQIAGLCLKSGNAVLLKGGREAMHTNRALFDTLYRAALDAGMPESWAGLLETREDVAEMLALDQYIDLIIPRGSNAFVRYIMDNSRIPVLGHADGICAVYVDKSADVDMAVRIAVDSKTQYVAACNAAETLLVHVDIAPRLLPPLAEAMRAAGVTLKGDESVRKYIACEPATEADYDTEFLALTLAVRVVDTLAEAIAHIHAHGSGHTDCIVTEDAEAARAFLSRVDSAGVYWNCSTRFADGYRYGLGAEVGISTGKVHARGPMGLEGLCTYKYKLLGHGQTVGGMGGYTHRALDGKCPV